MKPIARSQDDLLRLVTEHDGTITGLITRDIAGWLLRLNLGNRQLTKTDVARFTRILERGMWVNTGEPIIVSREGVINDGQHRLTAIHETGIPAPCDVRFGILRDAFQATGTGRRRTAADVLHIGGTEDAKQCAAIAKIVWHYDNGTIAQCGQPIEATDIQSIVAAYPVIRETARISRSLKMPVLQRGWFGGALALVARRSSVEEAREYAEAVDSGQGVETSPSRQLHERLVREAMSRSKAPAIDRIILAIKAWNAWVVHRPVGQLRVIDTERSSKGFPPIMSPPAKVSVKLKTVA